MILGGRKHSGLIIVFFLLFAAIFHVSAQDAMRQKLTLKSGKSYYGEVLVNNPDLVIIKLDDGSRFQFKNSEVELIQPATDVLVQTNEFLAVKRDSAVVSAAIDLSGGISFAKNKMDVVPYTQISIVFGTDKLDNGTIFLGLGLGYNHAFLLQSDESLAFVPLFLQLKKSISANALSPSLSLDLGYAFATSKTYSGGLYSKLTYGLMRKLNDQTSVHFGLFGGAQLLSAQLSEQFNAVEHSYYGTTSMLSFGLNVGLKF